MDTSRTPYDTLKQALYDGRVVAPTHHKLQKELLALEIDYKKNKIDHNSHNCFTGDTKITLEDGTSITMQELAERGTSKKVISFNTQTNSAEAQPIISPRLTKYVTELVEVTLDNGEMFRCTPDHLWLLKNGTYKEAQYLTEDAELQD